MTEAFALPAAAWWAYYTPLEARVEALAAAAAGDAALARVLDETRREIAVYARCGESYGYVFSLLRAK